MAWTPNSFPQRLRAVNSLTAATTGGAPFVLHGYAAVSTTIREGDAVINTIGTLTRAGSNPAINTIVGIVAALSPRIKDASQAPRQHATNATIPDRSKYDEDKSTIFFPWVVGNVFQGHLVTDATTDETADSSADIYIPTNPFLATNDWAFGITAAAVGGMSIGYVNPQATSIVGGALSLNPGPTKNDIGGATGTINPLILVLPKAGLLMAAS